MNLEVKVWEEAIVVPTLMQGCLGRTRCSLKKELTREVVVLSILMWCEVGMAKKATKDAG